MCGKAAEAARLAEEKRVAEVAAAAEREREAAAAAANSLLANNANLDQLKAELDELRKVNAARTLAMAKRKKHAYAVPRHRTGSLHGRRAAARAALWACDLLIDGTCAR